MAAVDYDKAIDSGEYWLEAAFGLHDPQEQMVGAFVLGVALIITSALSLGWTLALLWIPIVLFMIGFLRLAYAGAS